MRNIGVRAGLAASGMPNPQLPKGKNGDAMLGLGGLIILACAFPQVALILAVLVVVLIAAGASGSRR